MRIGFNVRFLHEIVRHIDSDEILLHFYDPHQAVMIEPKKTEEMNYNLLYLLMPVKLE
ncbi:MAG TPA: DNA polymerase III subunit beta, partial [candidate division WOR-3 bacterium]|nr:DNA polymerase III subunit beta [candidate division WOR-3 bacterium]